MDYKEIIKIQNPTESLDDFDFFDVDPEKFTDLINFVDSDSCENFMSADESASNFSIEVQPQRNFRFRYESDIKDSSHGMLNGKNQTPLLKLRRPKLESALYMTCSLYEEKENKLSWHLLRYKDKPLNFEPCLLEMIWDAKKCCYFANLVDVFICNTTKTNTDKYLAMKYAALEKFLPYPDAPTKPTKSKKADENKKQQHAVRLCFNVYTKDKNETYTHFEGPICSRPIYNKDDLEIKINMTPKIFAAEQEMFLYVKGIPNGSKIIAKAFKLQCQNDEEKWEKEIKGIKMPQLNVIEFTCPYYFQKIKNNKRKLNYDKCSCYIVLQLPEFNNEESDRIEFECLKFYNYEYSESQADQIDYIPTKRTAKSRDNRMVSDNSLLVLDAVCFSEGKSQQQPIQMDYIKKLSQLLHQLPNSYVIIQNLNKQFCAQNIKRNTLFHELIERDDQVTFSLMYTKHTDEMLQELIAEAVNDDRENLYHYACNLRRSSYIMPLTTMGCKIALMDFRGRTALHTAILEQQNDCIAEFQRIFQNHKDFEGTVVEDLKELITTAHNGGGHTVLHLAVLHNLINLTKDMLQFCKDNNINACRIKVLSDGNTIAHLALSKGLDDMFSLIESYVADVDQYKNYDGVLVEEMRANVLPNKLEKLYIGNTSGSE